MAGNFPEFKNMFPGGPAEGTFPTFGNMFPGAAPQPAGIGVPPQLTPLQETIRRSEEEDKKREADLKRMEAEHGAFETYATQIWKGGLSAITAPGAVTGAAAETAGGVTGWKGLEEFGRDLGESANGQAAMEALAFLFGGGGKEGLAKVREIQQTVEEQQKVWPTLSTIANLAGQATVALATGTAAGLVPGATKAAVVGTEAAVGAFEGGSAGMQAAYEQAAPLSDVYTSGLVGGILGGGLGATGGAIFGRPARQVVGKDAAQAFTKVEELEAMQGMRAAGIRASQAKRLHGRKGAEASRQLDIRTGLDATNYVLKTGEHAGENIFWKPGGLIGRKPQEIPILLEQGKEELGAELGQMRQVLDQQIQQAQTPYARALAERQALIANQAKVAAAARQARGPAQFVDESGATSENIRPVRFYRVQPKGLGVLGHKSKLGAEPVEGVFAYENPETMFGTYSWKYISKRLPDYEMVEIDGRLIDRPPDSEGVVVEPSRVVRRTPISEFAKNLESFRSTYQGKSPNEINAIARGEIPYQAQKAIEPVKFEIGFDERGQQQIFLRDGRHRLDAAKEAGADEILATVERVDKDGNVLSSQTRPVSLKPRTAPPIAKFEPPPVPQPTDDMPSAVQLLRRINDEVVEPLKADAKMVPAARSQLTEIKANLGWLSQRAAAEQRGVGAPLTFGELETFRRNIAKYTPVYPQISVAGLAPPTPPSQMLMKKVERMVMDHLDEKAEIALSRQGLDTLGYRRLRRQWSSLKNISDTAANEANFRRWNQRLSLRDIGVGAGATLMLAHGNVAGFMVGVGATMASKFWRERGDGIVALWAHRASHTLTSEMSGRMGAVVPLLRGAGATAKRTLPRTLGAWAAPDQKSYTERRKKLDDFISRPDPTVLSQQLEANPDIPDDLALPLGQSVYQKITKLARDFPKPRSTGIKASGALSSEELRVANAMWDATVDPFGLFSAFQNGHVDYTRVQYTWQQWPGLKQAAQAAMIDALHQQLNDTERSAIPDSILTQLDFLLGFDGTLQTTVGRGFSAQMSAAAQKPEEPPMSGPPLKLPMRPSLTERIAGQRQG